jgi:rubrerythrin
MKHEIILNKESEIQEYMDMKQIISYLQKENEKLKTLINKYKSRETPLIKIKRGGFIFCPKCGYVVDNNIPAQNYCDNCGQRLKSMR